MRDPFGIAFLTYYLVMAVIGMLIPDDILSHEWAREFSDFMANIVPQIVRVTELNIEPDINRFYFSILWAGSPFFVLLVISGAMLRGVNTNYIDSKNPILKPAVAALLIGLASYWLFTLFGAESSPQLTRKLIGNFLSRGLLGQVVFVNGPLFLLTGAYIMFPYFLLTGKYQKSL